MWVAALCSLAETGYTVQQDYNACAWLHKHLTTIKTLCECHRYWVCKASHEPSEWRTGLAPNMRFGPWDCIYILYVVIAKLIWRSSGSFAKKTGGNYPPTLLRCLVFNKKKAKQGHLKVNREPLRIHSPARAEAPTTPKFGGFPVNF